MSGVSFSGLLDSAKKVFEAPIKLVEKTTQMSIDATKHAFHEVTHNPILRTIAICAAIYFTAGIAMSAFPATAGYAAAMPGVSSAAGAMGVSAATADTAAAAAGAGSLGAGGAVAADAGATAATAGAAADAGAATAGVAGADAGAAAGTAAGAGGTAAGTTAAAAAPAAAAAAPGATAASTGMTGLEKIAAAKVASDAIGGALAPSPQQQAAAEKKFQGAFFGIGQSEGGTDTAIVPPGGFNLMPGGDGPQPSQTPKPGQAPSPGQPGYNAATAAPSYAGATGNLAGMIQQPAAPTGNDLLPGPGG